MKHQVICNFGRSKDNLSSTSSLFAWHFALHRCLHLHFCSTVLFFDLHTLHMQPLAPPSLFQVGESNRGGRSGQREYVRYCDTKDAQFAKDIHKHINSVFLFSQTRSARYLVFPIWFQGSDFSNSSEMHFAALCPFICFLSLTSLINLLSKGSLK